jgi:hypothetical protein
VSAVSVAPGEVLATKRIRRPHPRSLRELALSQDKEWDPKGLGGHSARDQRSEVMQVARHRAVCSRIACGLFAVCSSRHSHPLKVEAPAPSLLLKEKGAGGYFRTGDNSIDPAVDPRLRSNCLTRHRSMLVFFRGTSATHSSAVVGATEIRMRLVVRGKEPLGGRRRSCAGDVRLRTRTGRPTMLIVDLRDDDREHQGDCADKACRCS